MRGISTKKSQKIAKDLAVCDFSCAIAGKELFSPQSFALSRGELLALGGVNGSGKSLFLRCLCGTLSCDLARVLWRNHSISLQELSCHSMLIGHCPPFLASLSLFENLHFWAKLLCVDVAASKINLQKAESMFSLGCFWHTSWRRLSAGQKQRGGLSMLALKPQANLWLLDEPHASLDFRARNELHRHITSHLNGGGLAIVATHEDLSCLSQTIHSLTLGE